MAIAGFGVLMVATPAHAAAAPVVAVSDWTLLDTGDGSGSFPGTWSPTVPQAGSAQSEFDGDDKVKLTWSDTPSSNLGTSVETNNLGLTVAAGTVVSFTYELKNGAECTLGAPRMFVYLDNDTSTPGNRPDTAATANSTGCGTSGTVTFTIPSAGTIGYAGITYDNGKPGTVLISEVKIGKQQVLFRYNPPNVTVDVTGCEATLTFDNEGPYRDSNNKPGPWPFAFDYRLPGDPQLPLESDLEGVNISDPPLAPQPFDGLYNPVPVKAGESESVVVTLETTDDKIEYRLVRGAEQRMFFDWQTHPIMPGVCVAAPPADVAAPPADEDGLPDTGTSVTGVIAAGLGALAVGAALLLVTRRRRAAG